MTKLDVQGIQNIFFSGFVLTQLFSTVDQQIIPRLMEERGLYEARERKSKSYSWVVFISANIIVELFWQTLTSILVFVAWYFPTGLWRNGDSEFTAVSRGGLTFTTLWLFCMFISTFSQAIAVGIEIAETAVQIATLFFYLCLIFCG
jgi:ATP-binding cassette, subfamily G (WHITE), member 2, PDR